MAESLHVEPLYESNVVSVTDVRCRPHESCCGAEEWSTTDDIVFPRTGYFVHHVGRRETAADANGVLFFRRLEAYRVSHPITGGDDCTSLTFAPKALADAFATHDPQVRDHPNQPFPASRGQPGPSAILSLHRLRNAIRAARKAGRDLDSLAVDESALRLLDVVAHDAARPPARRMKQQRSDTLRAHRTLTENTRVVLSACLHEPLTLPDIARRVHSSPFHLARVFRRSTRLPIHKYLRRLRLRAALQRLADGESDLTGLALRLGFSSHSHLSDAFRHEFGLSPSALRDVPFPFHIREMSKDLKA